MHIAVLTVALSALLMLLCVVLAMQSAGLRGLFTHREPDSLDRAMQSVDPETRLAELRNPAIEQIAFDLRRLDRQRRSGPTRYSEVWLAAVLRAYDVRLQLACHSLGVPERLQPLDGVDREIERVRVEGELAAAGLVLRSESGHR